MTDQEKIAQYMASKGAKVIAPETRTMSERDVYLARRGVAPSENELIEQRRHVSTDHMGREIWVNGLGERIC